jgi:hypothetical protein
MAAHIRRDPSSEHPKISAAKRVAFRGASRACDPSQAQSSLISCRLALGCDAGVGARLAFSRPAGEADLAGLTGFVRGGWGATEAGWACTGSGFVTGGSAGGGMGVTSTGAMTGTFLAVGFDSVAAGLVAGLERKNSSAPPSKSTPAAATRR